MEISYIDFEISPVGNVPIFFRRWGNGPKVLLVHGWLDTSLRWRRLGEYLSSHYEIWALDLPAFGQTSAIPLRYTTLEIYAEILEKFIAHVAKENGLHSLVGHSMGGLLSLLALKNSRCFTKRLIVCGASVTGIGYLKSLTAHTNTVTNCLMAFQTLPTMLRRSIIKLGSFLSFRSPRAAKNESRDLGDVDAPAAASLLKQVCACNLLYQLQLPASPIPSVNVLVMRGRYDPFTSHVAYVQLAEILGGTFYEFRDAGHSPMVEQPDRSYRVIRQFLEKTKPCFLNS